MKTSLLITLALSLLFAKPASAADGPVYSIIRTNTGKVYVNCSVYKTYPDHVILEFENGGAKVLFADLAPEVREMLGYDPEKQAAYEKERTEKKRKEQEEQKRIEKYRAKTAKRQAAAYNAEAARYQLTAMHGGFDGHGEGGIYPYAAAYPYAGSYALGYPYDSSGYFSNNAYGISSSSVSYGYGDLPNSRYAQNCDVGSRSNVYGNGYGLEAYRVDPVTQRGVAFPVPCRTNWNGNHGWNGNGAWQGNPFNGHNVSSRAFRGSPQLNVVGRPFYNVQAPCRVPVATPAIGRFIPSVGSCVRR